MVIFSAYAWLFVLIFVYNISLISMIELQTKQFWILKEHGTVNFKLKEMKIIKIFIHSYSFKISPIMKFYTFFKILEPFFM